MWLMLVLPLFPDSLYGGLAPPIAKFHRLFQLLVNQSEVHLWHPNFRNGIEQTTPESFVHWQHFYCILHKIFGMFLRRLTFFIVKKHHIAYFFRYFNNYKINISFYTLNDLINYLYKICMLKCHLLSICTFDTLGWVWNDI